MLSTQRTHAQMSSSENNLVNTKLGQEMPKVTSRDLVQHLKKFKHSIAGEYLPNCVFDKLLHRLLVTYNSRSSQMPLAYY